MLPSMIYLLEYSQGGGGWGLFTRWFATFHHRPHLNLKCRSVESCKELVNGVAGNPITEKVRPVQTHE